MTATGERTDPGHVVGVLISNRVLIRQPTAEVGVPAGT
jgi:hypothetical protein